MISMKTMFQRAVKGLASQDFKRCITGADSCAYNGPNGMHCAWGWVDQKLDDEAEGNNVRGLFDKKIGLAAKLGPKQLDFATDLQQAHDAGTNATVKQRLIAVARKYKLPVPKVLK